ncbi:MAG TPA: cupin domain-containing protein [Bryobacteraceae bacterium]|nr:cupin domain-containing protein [Bryobacteraceae bacterium]
MRSFTLAAPAISAMLLAVQAYAQSAADMKTMCSAADVTNLIATARRERKADQPTFTQPLLKFAPYTASLEYRAAVGPAAVHENEAEMFYVIEGSGTLTLGGKLVNEKRSNAANLTGTAIEGGSSRKVAKGDFFVVPEKTPHWFGAIDGTLVLMSLHLPRPVASGQ